MASRAINDQLKELTLKGVVTVQGTELGRGAYGKVFTVKYMGLLCAAKEIHALLLDGVSPEEKTAVKNGFIRECYQSSIIRHPHIVQFIGVYYSERSDLPIMVMELLDTNVSSFVQKNKSKIPVETKLSILHDVSLGLSYLHGRDPTIVHRDLSSNNVLLTSHRSRVAKISDLGTAKMIRADSKQTRSRLTTAPGTLHFMPPEALDEDDPIYGTPVDVFSFAGIALHLFSEEWPTPSGTKKRDPETKKIVFLTEVQQRQQYLDKVIGRNATLRQMIVQCLDDDPDRRPSVYVLSETIELLKTSQQSDVQKLTNQLQGAAIVVSNIPANPIHQQTLQKFHKKHTCVDPNASEVIDLPKYVSVGEKLEFSIITNYHNDRCTTGGSQVSAQLKCNAGEVVHADVNDNCDGSYRVSVTTKHIGEMKLLVFINGQEIKESPYSVMVQCNYASVGRPIKIVNNSGDMGHPWGIAFSKYGKWAVADYSKACVYIFDDKDQLIKSFGRGGVGDGELNAPEGVAFDHNDYLYVVDCNNNRVQKFDLDGNYLLQFGRAGSGSGQLNGPVGITTCNGKIFVTDSNNHRISVFKSDGQFSHTIGSKEQLLIPYDVTVTANDRLLVADFGLYCICIFTLDGSYIGKFETMGSVRSNLDSPVSLTTDLCGFILVVKYGNHISIFNKDGEVVYRFGSTGSVDGKFKHPYGIAISPNGSIYVSDHGNKRVQIFSI